VVSSSAKGSSSASRTARADGGSTADLLRRADIALYQAKAAGKDRCVVFQPAMQEMLRLRFDLDLAVRGALAADELFLVYQPVVSVLDGTVSGVEALLRWRHATRGVIPPDQFIPLIEENGLIVPVGRWVIEQACAQQASWAATGLALTMAVNVSTRQLEYPAFVAELADALRTHGTDPGRLVLEITEGALIRDPEETVAVLQRIKALGVRVAIDDFGTGYSSMSYLQRLPVDVLKIDRSFIASMHVPGTAALVRTFVQLGAALGLETVAEGIEEPAQLGYLRQEGCGSAQGFYFSRPLDPGDLPGYVQGHRAPLAVPSS